MPMPSGPLRLVTAIARPSRSCGARLRRAFAQSSQEFALGFSGFACHRAGELNGSARYDPVTSGGLLDRERLHSHRPAVTLPAGENLAGPRS
jgi:hypothetical protein